MPTGCADANRRLEMRRSDRRDRFASRDSARAAMSPPASARGRPGRARALESRFRARSRRRTRGGGALMHRRDARLGLSRVGSVARAAVSRVGAAAARARLRAFSCASAAPARRRWDAGGARVGRRAARLRSSRAASTSGRRGGATRAVVRGAARTKRAARSGIFAPRAVWAAPLASCSV